jgi:hypothetical protein
MIRSLALFLHIIGVLTMFAGLALEAFGGETAAKATRRISGMAGPLIVLPGLYLGARFGVLGGDWMLASYGGIVAMMAADILARRSDALRRISLRVRATFALAVVFLMVAKPHAVVSVVVLGVALAISILVARPNGARQARIVQSTSA